jgi:hypothetical protein
MFTGFSVCMRSLENHFSGDFFLELFGDGERDKKVTCIPNVAILTDFCRHILVKI